MPGKLPPVLRRRRLRALDRTGALQPRTPVCPFKAVMILGCLWSLIERESDLDVMRLLSSIASFLIVGSCLY